MNYALTDGFEIFAVRNLSKREIRRERDKDMGGNLYWVPAVPPVEIPDDPPEDRPGLPE
jgi:hypothetical protein